MPRKTDIGLFLAQLAVWLVVLLLVPLAILLATQSLGDTRTIVMMMVYQLLSPIVLYFLNFYVFWKWLFSKHRYILFVLANLVVFFAMNWRYFYFFVNANTRNVGGIEMNNNIWLGWASGVFVYFLLNCAAVGAAIGIRHFLRTKRLREQLEEEKHKSTEAELAWLKNQINPHFLFNTLNNISSLTQIDAEAAQDAIAQLSDLLRYAIYKTEEPRVPIMGEVTFMKDYISLMRLRCNEKTVVNADFDVVNPNVEIPPLIFISLIENAFKHGVSASKPSVINIRLSQTAETVCFVCENTNYPKSDRDRSGSGVGLENTRRRLGLLYQENFTWQQELNNDMFHITITIPNEYTHMHDR